MSKRFGALGHKGFGCLCMMLVMTSMGLTLAETNLPAFSLLAAGRPLVIGHRGYSAAAPENTLPAFRLAMTAGADLVELDYHHSKEGVPVVLHDADLDRTTDATNRWRAKGIKVADRTLADIQTLDAGRWFDPQFAGTKVPTLVEALDFIQKRGVTLIERKAGDPATCVNLLRTKALVNRVVVQSFDWNYLTEFHRLAPEQVLGALGPPGVRENRKLTAAEKVLNAQWLEAMDKTGARIVVWNESITAEAVRLVHERGLKLWVYTINEPATAVRLVEMGVDGIITDNPGLIWRALALGKFNRRS